MQIILPCVNIYYVNKTSDAVLLRVLLACVSEDAHILGNENGSVEPNKMIK